jgi:hypothetical protein
MPATRPSTRVQRRAQPTIARRPSSRRRNPPVVPTESAEAAAPFAPHTATEAPSPSTAINDDMLQRIVSAVSQAVMAALGCNFRPQQSNTHAALAAAKSRSTNPSSN